MDTVELDGFTIAQTSRDVCAAPYTLGKRTIEFCLFAFKWPCYDSLLLHRFFFNVTLLFGMLFPEGKSF